MSIIFKIMLMVVVGLLVIATVAWFFFFNRQAATVLTVNNNQPAVTEKEPLINTTIENPPEISFTDGGAKTVSPEERTQSTLTRMASAFAERFGSYSNQSNYTNFEDLYDFMTPEMKRWAEKMVSDLRTKSQGNSSIYFGVTTKALSVKVNDFNDSTGQAEVLVKTQKREATGSTSNTRIYYQDLLIKFKKNGNFWQVDGAFWQ